MARGKKTSPEMIYKILTSYAVTHNYNQTAKNLGMPEPTVEKIVKEHKDTDEFKKLCEQKREEFADKASVIIDMLLERITQEVADNEKEIPLHHLTTAIGTLYDKRALSKGEMTQNLGFATNLSLDKLAEISGYGKKGDDAE